MSNNNIGLVINVYHGLINMSDKGLIPRLTFEFFSSLMSPVYLAACGETLNIDFTLPFHEFVPATCNTRFCLRVSIDACILVPIVAYHGVFFY